MGIKFSVSTLCPLVDFYDSEDFDSIYEASLCLAMVQFFMSVSAASEIDELLHQVDESNCIGTGKFAVVHLCNRKNQPEKKYALKVRCQANPCALIELVRSAAAIGEQDNVMFHQLRS